jgi:hypothetical protein
LRETRTRWRARMTLPHLPILAASLVFWGAMARAEHNPAHVLGLSVRVLSPAMAGAPDSDEHFISSSLQPRPFARSFFAASDMRIMLGNFSLAAFELRTTDRFAELDRELRLEAGAPASIRFGGEPFERKAFDFQRRCLNPCPVGGWGTCALETRAGQDECQAIIGRSLVSSAARRAPMVREVLRLMGSQTTKLPTDVDRGLRLSAMLIRGGGTVGIEARW